jgi:DNA polymerase-3 subunit beta
VRCSFFTNELAKAVALAYKGVPRGASEPVFRCLSIETDDDSDNEVHLRATDNRNALLVAVPALVKEKGHRIVDAALLKKIVSAMAKARPNGSECTLVGTDKGFELSSGSTTYELKCEDPKDFPSQPEVKVKHTCEADLGTLMTAFKQVLVVGGKDSPTFQDCLFECEDTTITVVATDSVRLCVKKIDVDRDGWGSFNVCLPRDAVLEVTKYMPKKGRITIEFGEDLVGFYGDDVELVCRQSDATFPKYRQILPKNDGTIVLGETKAMIDAINELLAVAADNKNKIHFDVKDEKVKLTAEEPVSKTKAQAVLEVSIDGLDRELCFNGKYVLDFLNVCGTGTFKANLTSKIYPAAFSPYEDDSFLYILMPINL